MNPHKAKASYAQVSESTGISLINIQTINSFYWKEVRVSLSGLINPNISLIGLGEMNIKHWNIPIKIKDLTNRSKKWETINTESPMFKSYTADLLKVQNMKVMIDKDTQRKKEYELKRRIYEAEHNTTLEK